MNNHHVSLNTIETTINTTSKWKQWKRRGNSKVLKNLTKRHSIDRVLPCLTGSGKFKQEAVQLTVYSFRSNVLIRRIIGS